MFFKYNNADNPHTSVTLTPTSIFGGLYQIGGIITIFGLINAMLYSYNKKSIEAMLLREWKEKLKKRITMELKRVPAPKSSDAADLSQSMIEDPDQPKYKTKVGELFFDDMQTSEIDKFKHPVVKNLLELFNNVQSIESIQEWLSYEKFIDLIIDFTSKNGLDG